ncbi:MAG: hypothetical protein IT375_23180 [Polyangiaceae bacterium]|nr:hypothetical protein [Polyangiaceae bacterium]
MRVSRMFVVAACGVSLAVACGGDDEGGGSNGTGGSGTGGSGTGGTASGGTSGGGAGGGAGATGGSAGATGGSGGATGGSGGATGGSGGTGGTGGATGGSGGTGGSYPLDCKSFTSTTLDAACTSFSTEYCKYLGKCAPVFFSMFAFKDEAECASRLKLVCQNAAAAPGNGTKPALYAAYGSWLSKLTCNQMWDGTFVGVGDGTMPPECGTDGTLADGKTCFNDTQCKGECDKESDAACGKCVTPAAGSACQFSSDCGDDFYCDFGSNKCVAKLAVGATCSGSSSNQCVSGAYCDSNSKKCVGQSGAGSACTNSSQCKSPNICGANKLCKAPGMGALGASCDPAESQSCNSWMGLECDKLGKTCVASPAPGPGQQCGMLSTDGGTVFAMYCSGGAKCTDHTTGPDTCMLPVADGASCSTTDGPPCKMPAECVAGKCVVPSGTTCPAN